MWAQLSSKISRLPRPLALACCLHICAQLAHHPSGQALGTVLTTSISSVHRAPWRWPPLLACHQQEGAASDSFPDFGAHVTPGEVSTTPPTIYYPLKSQLRYMEHKTAKFSFLAVFCKYTCCLGSRNSQSGSLPFSSSYPDSLPSFGALLRSTSSWKPPFC